MSKKYRDEFGETKITKEEMRAWLMPQFPTDAEGNPIYLTEQSHKDQCDINKIIKRYDKTGLISHVSKIEAKYGDVTGHDFKVMSDKIANARSLFEGLPSHIRKRFNHDPTILLTFMDNAANRDEAIKLGLINENWPPEQDGLGEHVPTPQDPQANVPDPEPQPEA